MDYVHYAESVRCIIQHGRARSHKTAFLWAREHRSRSPLLTRAHSSCERAKDACEYKSEMRKESLCLMSGKHLFMIYLSDGARACIHLMPRWNYNNKKRSADEVAAHYGDTRVFISLPSTASDDTQKSVFVRCTNRLRRLRAHTRFERLKIALFQKARVPHGARRPRQEFLLGFGWAPVVLPIIACAIRCS